MRLRSTIPEGSAMIRRSLPFLATLLAFGLLLLAAAPASAYNNENKYHLRLHRLDPLKCGTPIGIQAKLTDKHGHRISGATINFTITKGKPGDSLSPSSAVTNSKGKAVTYVTLACTSGTHVTKILATGPNGARARITLVLHRHHDEDNDDDNDHHHHEGFGAAGILTATTGSGTGGGQVATVAARTVNASPVSTTIPAPAAVVPLGAIVIGALTLVLAASWRRRPRRPPAV